MKMNTGMENNSLMKFWSSIITNDDFQNQLISVLTVEDKEERALQLLSRALFLLIMEIKFERDEAVKQMKESSSVCSSCRNKTSPNEDNVKSDHHVEEVDFASSCASTLKIIPECDPIPDEGDNKGCRIISSSPVLGGKDSERFVKNNKNNQCFSLAPKKNVLTKNRGEEVECAKEDKKETPFVMVPETVALEENDFYVNVEKRKALTGQTIFIPETPELDISKEHGKYGHQNIDFWEDSKEQNEIESSYDGLREMTTPTKSATQVTTVKSPILGKHNRHALVHIQEPATKPESSKSSNLEKNENKLMELKKKSQPSDSSEPLTATPRYSPLVFSTNVSPSLNDSDITSPSLLKAVKSGTRKSAAMTKSYKMANESEDSCEEAVLVKHLAPPNNVLSTKKFTARNKPFQRAHSSLHTSPKRRSLRKHQTTDNIKKEKERLYNIVVTSPPSTAKKGYKQKTISECISQSKNLSKFRGGAGGPKQEDADLQVALRESLKTKELDDLQRQAEKKRKRDTMMHESPVKIPKLSPPKKSPKKSSLNLLSPAKKSPMKKKGLKLKKSPFKKGINPEEEQDIPEQKENLMGLTELLDEVCKSPPKQQKPTKQKSPKGKLCLSRAKRKVIDDSYDLLPGRDKSPSYAHKGDVVRGRAARQNMEGWGCHQCQLWYQNQDLDPHTKKQLMNKCSRHRSKHNPISNTPKGFWNPDWEDDDESS